MERARQERRGAGFGEASLDRLAERRRDATWVEGALGAAGTRFAVSWRSRCLLSRGGEPRAGFLGPREVADLLGAAASVALLGRVDGAVCFGVDLDPGDPTVPDRLAPWGELGDLREVAAVLDAREVSLLAQARGLAHWHRRHRFCGSCGGATRSAEAGHVRVCQACGEELFPRTDPAVIVRVGSPPGTEDRCLLGRQAAWPGGRYSVLAGFVEPGESLEAAVAREVREETGVELAATAYHSSQPWPFPSSLMVGFTAVAATEELRVDAQELEDARWFSRPELRRALEAGEVSLPPAFSLSRALIQGWFDPGA